MSDILLNVSINTPKWEKVLPEVEKLSSQIATLTVNHVREKQPKPFLMLPKSLSFNLCLSNDTEVHALNKEFRQIDKPTNILSFANIDDPLFDACLKSEDIIEMGDMIIAIETLQKEAQLKNISLHNHFCHLLIHGILHLLGYDHIQDEDATIMETLEIDILHLLNISNPYEE